MKIKFPIAVILLQLLVNSVLSQNNELKFNLVQGNNGKPLGKIRNMTQDPHGYMWFADESPGARCIYRYDGNRFTTFRHDDNNPNSLGGTAIQSVYSDDEGMIWVGSKEGLDKFNPETGIFTHYPKKVNDPGSPGVDVTPIVKDKKGRLWLGTGIGLDCFNEKTGKFIHYRNEPGNEKSLSSNMVWTIFEDRQGVIWVGTGDPWFNKDPEDGGLNRFNEDGSFTRYMHNPSNPKSLINNKVAAIFEDSRGTFWVGTSGDGLHTMDRKTGIFERHPYNPNAPGQLSRPPLKPGEENDKITFINEDSMGTIWIGSRNSGINRYDYETEKITHYEGSHGFPDSTSWNSFTSRDGVVWITTENNNLFRADPFYKPVRSITTVSDARGFLEDKQGLLWVGTNENGLFKYDQQLNFIEQLKNNPLDSLSIPPGRVRPLFQNQENIIWVSADKGIRVMNEITKKFSRFNEDENLSDFNDSGAISVIRDKQEMLWFGTWGQGLVRYNPIDHSINHFYSNKSDTFSISSNNIGPVIEDRSGMLWAGSDNGINRLDKKTGKFTRYFGGTWALHVFQDSEGSLWSGNNIGLYRYNEKEDRFLNFFDSQSEFYSLSIGGITEDGAKNLWFFSHSAIISLNLITGQTFMYGSKYGIVHGMATWKGLYKNRKGQLFIPHDIGFYTFSPEELTVKTSFKIIITNLLINNLPLLSGKASPIQNPIEEINDLVLPYNQNNISFNYAAIDYREPQLTTYFTMLENYDNVWREALYEKGSAYYNLPPGKYVYRVKAFNIDGIKVEKQITILINPPWWKTWWAYCVYGLLLLAAIFAIYRYQKQRIIHLERQKRQQFELAQAKEIEKAYTELKSTQALLIQSEKMASLGELTAGIAHEIQNPLNFVNNFSEVNKEMLEELKAERLKPKAERDDQTEDEILNDVIANEEKINHHGKRADAIVKGMLQHSRSSTGHKELTDINALTDEYLRISYHGLRAKDKLFNATLQTDFDKTIGNINIIPQDIGRVILNIINNAFYAVNEKQKAESNKQKAESKVYEPIVFVSTKKLNNNVEIKVSDNGNGIPQKIMDKIFQPFFTTKPTGQGTGLGLSLAYDIIKAHGGEIKVETKESEGSEFCIILPV